MNSVYKTNEDKNEFDFTAIKVLLSVIAIFLSAAMPNALAVTGNAGSNRPQVFGNILAELKNQRTEPIQRINGSNPQCGFSNHSSRLNKKSAKFVNFESDFMCTLPGSDKKPNES